MVGWVVGGVVSWLDRWLEELFDGFWMVKVVF